MFSFEIPQWAALQVSLPTGGATTLVHVGGGRFLSKVPPIALTGARPDFPFQQEGIPVEWDGTTLPGDKTAHPAVFGFDVMAAARVVQEAAAAGDTFAQAVMAEMEAAQRTLDSREALGVMDAAPVVNG